MTSSFIYRSIAVYGCFAAGLASLIIFAAISWFNGKIDTSNGEETNRIVLSRSIRITVYLITALLAVASSVISLIDVDQTARHIVPVRISKNNMLFNSKQDKIVTRTKYSFTRLNNLLLHLKFNN